MSAIHIEFTEYYYPDEKDYPSKIFFLQDISYILYSSFVKPNSNFRFEKHIDSRFTTKIINRAFTESFVKQTYYETNTLPFSQCLL